MLACTVAVLKHPPTAALAVLHEVASDVLATVATRVRPRFLLSSPLFADLVGHAPRLCEPLPVGTRANVTVAITHVFLLPWFDVPDPQQDWENRQATFSRTFGAMFEQVGRFQCRSCMTLVEVCRMMRAVDSIESLHAHT
eukprot:m.638715 g.638715  ORF g.638715 m.638715 type:complete len:140 (-) comp22607_c0_seq15:195-614(-)